MAHHRRRYPRARTPTTRSKRTWFMSAWPARHDIICHRRPKRRATKALLRALLAGRDPDGVAWPLRSNRPHQYYW
jgi:hypothetical protein